MVSVIMPAYKASATINKSVDSVLAQTCSEWELIVVVEDEESAASIALYNDSRIKVIKNETRIGVAKSRNRGISAAKGEYIAFLDADDIWAPEKLDHQLALGAKISFTASAFMDASGKTFDYILRVPEKFCYADLLKRNLMSCSSVIVRKEIMQPFPETSKLLHEDYVTWLRIVRKTEAVGLDEALLSYRISSGSKSGNRLQSGLMTYNSYREVGLGMFDAITKTLQYAMWSMTKRRLIHNSQKGHPKKPSRM